MIGEDTDVTVSQGDNDEVRSGVAEYCIDVLHEPVVADCHLAVPTFEMWSCVVEQRWFVTALLGIDLKKSFWLQRHARTASWEAAPQIPNVGLGASPQTATVMGSSASRFNPTQILPFGFGPPR